uniref:Uncharacterized protein n=1 Tax=Arion vulgaris TaxID=1028688 RepID=A0A0B7AEA8_9EUPU
MRTRVRLRKIAAMWAVRTRLSAMMYVVRKRMRAAICAVRIKITGARMRNVWMSTSKSKDMSSDQDIKCMTRRMTEHILQKEITLWHWFYQLQSRIEASPAFIRLPTRHEPYCEIHPVYKVDNLAWPMI